MNIKKGQFVAPHDIRHAAEKVASTGNLKVLITERGSSFGYHNLVVDMRGLKIMRGQLRYYVASATKGNLARSRPFMPPFEARRMPAQTAVWWRLLHNTGQLGYHAVATAASHCAAASARKVRSVDREMRCR